MLLRELARRGDGTGLPPPDYREASVRYVVHLSAAGEPLGPPVDTADPREPGRARGARRAVPQASRGNALRPLLLSDGGNWTLGIGKPDEDKARTAACHAAYRALVGRCLEETGEPAVQAVDRFLADDPAGRLALPADFAPDARIVFSAGGVYPTELPAVQAFWSRQQPGGGPEMQCLVCLARAPAMERMPEMLAGVPGGKSTGTALLSANDGAFWSRGQENGFGAPICRPCAARAARGANALLADRDRCVRAGNVAYLIWAREPARDDGLARLLGEADEGQVRALLGAARAGTPPAPGDDDAFFVLALAGSGARAAVRDWVDTTAGAARASLARWFQDTAMVGAWGEPGAPLGLQRLALATVREKKDLRPRATAALARRALAGTPVPRELLAGAVGRARAERDMGRERAALTRLALIGTGAIKEGTMEGLDEASVDPGYLCGRLLAALQNVQQAAMPQVKATITDRYFGAASSTPGLVFPRLLRGAGPHLDTLRKKADGEDTWADLDVERILAGLPAFPRTLPLEAQGRFCLGFYHQRAHMRARKRAAGERKAAGAPRADAGIDPETGRPAGDAPDPGDAPTGGDLEE